MSLSGTIHIRSALAVVALTSLLACTALRRGGSSPDADGAMAEETGGMSGGDAQTESGSGSAGGVQSTGGSGGDGTGSGEGGAVSGGTGGGAPDDSGAGNSGAAGASGSAGIGEQCDMAACDPIRADSCSGGACRCGAGAACAAGQTCCSGSCVDTNSSFTNCGSCGGTCGGGTTTCISGQCSCGTHLGACGTGTTCCGGGCFNTNTDANHCGLNCDACNQVVPVNADRVCNGGECAYRCQDTFTDCGNGCFNMASDSYHCGSCTHSCKGDTCSDSTCKPTRLTNSSDAAPYFTSPGVPTMRNTYVTYDGLEYHANDAGKITRGSPGASASDLCILESRYLPVSEGGADGVAADAQYVYGLFNDGNQNNPVLVRCQINGSDTQVPEVVFEAGATPLFGAFGGIKDTGDALYWGVRETATGPIVVYRLVR